MFRNIFALLTIICFFTTSGFCAAKGTSGAQFLKIVASPRASALGSAFTAFSDDVNSISFNPAGLAFLKKKEIALVQNNWFQDISNQYLAFGYPSKYGTFGVSAVLLTVKDITKVDNNQVNQGTYGASDMAAGLSYANTIGKRFSYGFTVKSISQKIDDQSASGLAGDAGALYRISSKVDVGASVLNVGDKIKFINEGDPLPTIVRAGVFYTPLKGLKIGADASMPNDADTNFGGGIEYSIKAGDKLVFPVRAGYKSGYETEELSGLAAGAGVMYNNVMGVDFAWVPMGILGDTMKFGLTYKF